LMADSAGLGDDKPPDMRRPDEVEKRRCP